MPNVREFFLAPLYDGIEWPPTTTAQTREVGVNKKTGKPYLYKPDQLLQAEINIRNSLARFRPETPITNKPIRLTVKWLYPITNLKKHRHGEYKLTRPDTDNLQKLLKDCMTDLGFWVDDCLVCSEIVEKFWADTPGIYVRIEVMDA